MGAEERRGTNRNQALSDTSFTSPKSTKKKMRTGASSALGTFFRFARPSNTSKRENGYRAKCYYSADDKGDCANEVSAETGESDSE